MSTIEITNQVRIQNSPDNWFTVEDWHLDVGCDGLTVSSWSTDKDNKEVRVSHVCIDADMALAVADAIYKLFKKEKA